MPIILESNGQVQAICLQGILAAEEAEELLEQLLTNRAAPLDLSQCEHCHAAVLQVILAASNPLKAPPKDRLFAAALQQALSAS